MIYEYIMNNFKKGEPIFINDVSDGTFPNHNKEPAVYDNMKQLQETVLENNADFGVAYDGDGDRLGFVMDNGEILPIEYFMIMVIDSIHNKVNSKKYTFDVKCSQSISDYITKIGCEPECYRTGASYLQKKVHDENLPFACEYSGHAYFQDRDLDSCSAIYASLRFLEIMSHTNQKLSDIVKDFPKYYSTEEIKIPCDDSIKFDVVDDILKCAKSFHYNYLDIDGVKIKFTDGWVLVRASNTGPCITLRAEATSPIQLELIKEIYMNMVDSFAKSRLKNNKTDNK